MGSAYVYLTVGAKGQGKSLYDSNVALDIINNYYRTEKRYPQLQKRIYFSKQKFSEKIDKQEAVYRYDLIPTPVGQKMMMLPDYSRPILNNPKGHLYYWSKVYQLRFCPRIECWKGTAAHDLHHADIQWDEIGSDMPPDGWKDVPNWQRQLFSHARKRGNRIFANTQDYHMVDVHVRRQIDLATVVKKVIGSRDLDVTRPNPRFVFVFQMRKQFDPVQIENEDDPRKLETSVWPKFSFYTRRDVSIFDTEWELPPYRAEKMEEILHECLEGDACRDPKHRYKVTHIPA